MNHRASSYRIYEVIRTLNKSKGNMYGFVTHTWNPIKGRCSHDCKYCYMKRWKQNPLRLAQAELKTDLGGNNFIFVGSSTDMFARDVPEDWILAVLDHCYKHKKNQYLFQSKNPARLNHFIPCFFGLKFLLATTIETNRHYKDFMGESPSPRKRYEHIKNFICKKMITIEPVMDFDLDVMVEWIREINPVLVAIGADSQRSGLPEPPPEKIQSLIAGLQKITEVVQKPNLKRLMR